MSLTHETDHVGKAKARLLAQYKGKPKFEALIANEAARWQVLEDVFWSMWETTLDTATGVTLDRWFGAVVGERRRGTFDVEYRQRIRARARAHRAGGTGEGIYKVFVALLGPDFLVQFAYGDAASAILYLQGGPVTSILVPIYLDFLRVARSVSQRVLLQWFQGLTDDTFTLGLTTFLDGDHAPAATTLSVLWTAAQPPFGEPFPATGTLRLDEGTADEEDVTYTHLGVTAGIPEFRGVSPTANAHLGHCTVSLVGSAGKGFDEGEMAGIKEA